MKVSVISTQEVSNELYPVFNNIGKKAAIDGDILRVGGMFGMEQCVHSGFKEAGGDSTMFLPWRNYLRRDSRNYPPSFEAMRIAKGMYPRWNLIGLKKQSIIACHAQILLGEHCDNPSDVFVTWFDIDTITVRYHLRVCHEFGMLQCGPG